MRTVYDGRGFEVIREGETFLNGSLTTRYAGGGMQSNGMLQSNQATGERYRWIGEGGGGSITADDGYTVQGSRYGARGVTLYGNGEAVAVSSGTTGRVAYLGKDILGSVRTATTDSGILEDRYEYDAFGVPYKGDLSGGMNLGYTGKPYDSATGLYNYGYRDYSPQAARFTTLDPIRDGSNWFAYVNNDPVNYIDLWGLSAKDSINWDKAPIFYAEGITITANGTLDTVVSGIVGYDVTKPATPLQGFSGSMNVLSLYTGMMGYIAEGENFVAEAKVLGWVSRITGVLSSASALDDVRKNLSVDSVSKVAGKAAGVGFSFPLGLLAEPSIELTVKAIGKTATEAAVLDHKMKTSTDVYKAMYDFAVRYK